LSGQPEVGGPGWQAGRLGGSVGGRPEIYRMLVIERKWSASRYRSWFRAAVANILA
jgi:hypothetical protein